MLRHTLNHLGVVVASKVMPLASLLVYSRFLEPAEYGVVSLFFSYVWIFGIALTLNLHTGIGRFIYDKQYRASDLVGTTLLAVAVAFGVGLPAALVSREAFAALLNLPSACVPFLFAVVAGLVAESLLLQVLTARERSGQLLAIVASRSLGSLAVTVALLVYLPSDKYLAVIYAESGTGLLLVIYLLWLLQKDRPWRFSWAVLRAYGGYSIPLIPYMLSLTLLSQFDRVMIDRFIGKEATGLYSVGYNLGIMLVMVSSALLNALNPRFFSAMDAKRYGDVRRDAFAVFTVCLLCACALILFGPALAALAIPAQYAEGFALIPMVALGGLACALFQIWGRVIGYAKQTYLLSLIAVGATVLKIGLNLLLIPAFKAWGGVLTTLIAYGFMAVAVVVVINRRPQWPRVNVRWEALWLAGLAAVVAVDFYVDTSSAGALAAKIALFLIVMGLGWQSVRGTFLLSRPVAAQRPLADAFERRAQ